MGIDTNNISSTATPWSWSTLLEVRVHHDNYPHLCFLFLDRTLKSFLLDSFSFSPVDVLRPSLATSQGAARPRHPRSGRSHWLPGAWAPPFPLPLVQTEFLLLRGFVSPHNLFFGELPSRRVTRSCFAFFIISGDRVHATLKPRLSHRDCCGRLGGLSDSWSFDLLGVSIRVKLTPKTKKDKEQQSRPEFWLLALVNLLVIFYRNTWVKPFKSDQDSDLAISLSYSLQMIFLSALLIKVNATSEDKKTNTRLGSSWF